jgi:large subunit ribosomal protein L3
MVDFRKRSTTAGQELTVPVTVVETPPMKIAAVRFYRKVAGGKVVSKEVWADELDPHLGRRINLPKEKTSEDSAKSTEEKGKKTEKTPGDDLRLVVHTQPYLVSSIPSKTPEMFEVGISGENLDERRKWAMDNLGKEVKIEDFVREGEMVDVVSVTKGKGFQGHTKRFHVKLQPHKNSKHRRMIGTLGPHNPSYVTYRIPQAGQMGYHRRTEYNKRVLKILDDPMSHVNPKGGFIHYGLVHNPTILVHGTIPGPSKRLIRFRLPMRFRGGVEKIDIKYLSTESKRGA